MLKRPTVKPFTPDIKVISVGTTLYKGISSNNRTYVTPVFFSLIKRHAEEYAKARLGEYVTTRNLKLLNLTPKTVRYLLSTNSFSQPNKDRIQFMTGVDLPSVNAQMKLVNKITEDPGHRAHIRAIMTKNLHEHHGSLASPAGRKSFMNIDLSSYQSICRYCAANGYDGAYSDEQRSVFHPLFGSELVLCNPRAALKNINFKLNNGPVR